MDKDDQKQPDRKSHHPLAVRERAEELVRLTQTETSEMDPGNMEAIVHELQVHQIELERQNEELRQSQLSLAESHDRYLDLFNFAPVGYVMSDRKGQIVEANLTAANMLQLPRRDLIKKKLLRLASNPSTGDSMHRFFQSVFSEETSQCCELELVRGDGSTFFARLESIAFDQKDGSAAYCRTALIDITEEREAKKWKEQAERLRGMVENLPAGAIFVESHDRIFLNRNAEEITGFSCTELNSVSDWFSRLYPGQATQTRRLYEESRDAGFPELLTSRISRKNGWGRDIEFAAHRFGEHEVWLVHDITACREAEKKLKERQNHISVILETAADAIFTIDPDGFILEANPAAENMFGYQGGKLVGVIASVLMPNLQFGDTGLYCRRDPEAEKLEPSGKEWEVTASRKDGSSFIGELSVSEGDKFGIYTGILRDISDRKLADEVLRERRELSEKLIESAPNIVLVLDMEGRIVRVNSTFEKLSGRTMEEIEGQDWFDNFVPDRNREKNRELFRNALSGAPLHEFVDPIIAKNAVERHIEWIAAYLTDVDGSNIGLLCTGNDVTDRLRLEGEVIAAVEEDRRRIAQELHDGVGSLLSGINFHLGAFKGKIEAKTPIEPSEIEAVASLVSDAIAQSQDIAKGIHPIGSAPEELVSALETLTSRMDFANAASCQFHCETPVEIGDPVVANQLFRITQEAVNNAAKHSGATTITVNLSQKDGHIRVEIFDDGTGFDPDSQGPEGLGLHIMGYRTRAISGTLTITRSEEKGTRVVCSVPGPKKPSFQ